MPPDRSSERPDRAGPIRTVAETASTNDDVAALARSGASEGLWLRAERQTRGRGRIGRQWQSVDGNLYASTLVRLRPGDPAPATLALVAAVALQEVARSYAPGTDIRIKWPNDLLVGGAKLSGILLERVDDAVVIGFGVNLAGHPEDTARPSTSLRAVAGSAPHAGTFVRNLAETLAGWIARWRSEGLAPIRAQWLAHAHPKGTALAVTAGKEGPVEGEFGGLDDQGALLLHLADGSLRAIQAGDVFLMNENRE